MEDLKAEAGRGAGCHGELGGQATPVHLTHTHTHRSTHMENWRSLASMLRCLMHILVRAEPMSRVPPESKHTDTEDNLSVRPGAADHWKTFNMTQTHN